MVSGIKAGIKEAAVEILGVGLSRTGTRSLDAALQQLGYKTLHWASERLRDIFEGRIQFPNFRRYDDVDAVTDIPAAYFWRELWAAYPHLKFIYTGRNQDEWYESVAKHYARIPDTEPPLQTLVYGSTKPTPWLYKKHFRDHLENIVLAVPPERLLMMNIFNGDGWEKLCPFLERSIPNTPFPNVTDAPSDFKR